MSKYRNHYGSGGQKGPGGKGGGRKQPTLPSSGGIGRREVILLGAGAGAVALAQPVFSRLLSSDEFDLMRSLRAETGGMRGVLIDNTDQKFITPVQASAIRRMILEQDKNLYRTDMNMFVGILQNSTADPLSIVWEGQSPGNELTANDLWQTAAQLETAYRRDFEPGLAAAVDRGLQPAIKPEATPLMEAIQTALLHARRVAGPDAQVTLKVVSDLLVHERGGLSAYASETSPRHPTRMLPERWRQPAPGLCRIEFVGISRAGRRTRSGRDLGQVQREVGRLIAQNLRDRGADVLEIDWV